MLSLAFSMRSTELISLLTFSSPRSSANACNFSAISSSATLESDSACKEVSGYTSNIDTGCRKGGGKPVLVGYIRQGWNLP